MRPRRQNLNIIFLYLGHVANWMGDMPPLGGGRHPFLKIFLFGIYFWNFVFLKYKNEKTAADLVAELGWLPLPACKPPAVSCHTGLPACAGWPACWPSSLLGPLLRWPANAAARPERSRPAPPKRAHARLPPPLSASPSAGSRRACWPSASHALVRGRKRPGACSCKLHLPLRFWTD